MADGAQLSLQTKLMQENILKLAEEARGVVGESLYEWGEEKMGIAQRRTPVEFGILRDSGQVEEPVWKSKTQVSLEMGFGGAADEYAIIVHEDLEAHHDDGQAKFLESTLNEAANDIAEEVGGKVQRKLGL